MAKKSKISKTYLVVITQLDDDPIIQRCDGKYIRECLVKQYSQDGIAIIEGGSLLAGFSNKIDLTKL